MEDYWNIKIIHNYEEYFRLKKYQVFRLIEPLWESYLTEYLDYPGTTFEEYLRTQWFIVFRPEEVNRKIQIWFETRNKIFQ